MERVPAIDISGLAARDARARRDVAVSIGEACRSIGFLCIVGHGVPAASALRLRAAMRDFFDLDGEEKRRVAITPENYRGYIPFAAFTPNAGAGVPDRYEGYKLHLEVGEDDSVRAECGLYGPNVWPRRPAGLRAAVSAYWQHMDRLAHSLLRAFALALDLDEDFFVPAFGYPMTNMTLLHYPPQPEGTDGFGIHPHKDTDAFTILWPDPVGGLEVRRCDGRWIAVESPPEALIVNIGDMMELWSGGHFVSTPHRVINRTGRERYSFPYFAVPRHDVTISPAVTPRPGFERDPLPVGYVSEEVWRTNWRHEKAKDPSLDLGTIEESFR
jgi:isopenicillin N synthase-like dioxygenase